MPRKSKKNNSYDTSVVETHRNGKTPLPFGVLQTPSIGAEPAATAKALADSPEGEVLYQDIKEMEHESLTNPDIENVLLEMPATEDVEALPIATTIERLAKVSKESEDDHVPAPKVPLRPASRRRTVLSLDGDDEDDDEEESLVTSIDALADLDPGFVTDPVRLYLREIVMRLSLQGNKNLRWRARSQKVTLPPRKSLCWQTSGLS